MLRSLYFPSSNCEVETYKEIVDDERYAIDRFEQPKQGTNTESIAYFSHVVTAKVAMDEALVMHMEQSLCNLPDIFHWNPRVSIPSL
mmetsp:Transcript_693/g.1955  ORF Transcript_693/g.1955 Transcript_693/m.1955 type:complete len:87 (+) Transcript_693:1220-1480(+)